MTKTEQREVNNKVETAMKEACRGITDTSHFERLRSCSAYVCETTYYYVLRSYYTIVAAIDKRDGTLYDALRTVYGYTATSAQHIAKFRSDYGWGTAYTSRPV